MTENEMLEAALAYAEKGIPVFPCGPGGKEPVGGLAPHGWQNATTDAETIRRWWKAQPEANIATEPGASGHAVADLDCKKGAQGYASWGALTAKHGPEIGLTRCANTPSGGLHVWYAVNGQEVHDTDTALGPGIELRCHGRYVLLPPSIINGVPYTWRDAEAECAPFPPCLADLLKPKPRKQVDTPAQAGEGLGGAYWLAQAVKKADNSNRHNTGKWLAVQLRAAGLPLGDAELFMEQYAERCEELGECQEPAYEHMLRILDWAYGLTNFDKTPAIPGNGPVLEEPDYLQAAPTNEDSEAPPEEDSENQAPGVRPRINAGENRLQVVSGEAWAAIRAANDPPYLFRHGGLPARLELGEAPMLAQLTPDRLRYEAARAADWYKRMLNSVTGEMHEVKAKPPPDVIRDMLAYPTTATPLPSVTRIVRAPTFAPDGTLQATPGYHACGRVIVVLDDGLVIPRVSASPTRTELDAAVAAIDDLLINFPRVADADRAHAIALALLPFVRDMIAGPTPLHLVEAPAAGSGKGLLVSAMLIPAVGADLATLSAGRDEDEWRKRITAVLRAGKPAVNIDNIKESIESGALSNALTTDLWEDRLLGATEMLTLPVRCVWVATGNNPMLSTEIARRCVRIRLDPKRDQPWRRDPAEFTHPALLEYARAHRGRLIGAILTMVQAWIGAGKPPAKTAPLGSYEVWARVIGGILEHAGVGGFLGNLDELYERADSEGAMWRRLVGVWWETYKEKAIGVGDLFPLADGIDSFDFGKAETERGKKTMLGKGLKAKEDMVLGGYRIMAAPDYKRLAQYCLAQAHTDVREG